MAEKRKISCPEGPGTGENKKYESYINYSSYDEKNQEGYIIKIDTEGNLTALKTEVSLKVLQMLVGGYIETVSISVKNKSLIMILDEEGKLRHKRLNFTASKLIAPFDFAVGTAVILKSDGEELTGFEAQEAFELLGDISVLGGRG